ncbi:MAG: DUF5721 family protein [Clostridiales bacterium]|jgi:hypothetical protein|nr:DUF5721 family protein [Clostridiales bacterium]
MVSLRVADENVKSLMNLIFAGGAFDGFELRSASVFSFAGFEFSGLLSRAAVSALPAPRKYALWSELKRHVYAAVKGKVKPELMKFVFCAGAAFTADFHKNAKALFLNMYYENGETRFTTATAQKAFELSKELDEKWDEYIRDFFSGLGVETEDPDEV